MTAGIGFGLAVAAEDAFGNIVTSYQGAVNASLAGNTTTDTLGGTTSRMTVNGVATFSGLMLRRANSADSLQLTSGILAPANTNSLSVNPAAPSQLVLISQPPEKVPARQPFRFTAVVEDAFGNVVTDYHGSVTASLATAPRHAMIRGPLTVLATGGDGTFLRLDVEEVWSGLLLERHE